MPSWWNDCTSPRSIASSVAPAAAAAAAAAAGPSHKTSSPRHSASEPQGAEGAMSTSHEVNVKCCHKLKTIPLSVPADSCFGDIKASVGKEIGIEAKYLKLLFRGREKQDGDAIYSSGVKDGAKLLLVESEEYRKVHGAELAAQGVINEPEHQEQEAAAAAPPAAEESSGAGVNEEDARLLAQVDVIRAEVDKMGSQVEALEAAPGGAGPDPKKAKMLNELLTQKLLALDNLDVTGKPEVRQRRKEVINRANQLCDKLEQLKTKP